MSTEEPAALPPERRRLWRRFGLRTLFTLVAICAVLLAFFGRGFYHDYLRREAVAAIEANGGVVLRRGDRIHRVYLRGEAFDDAAITRLAPHLRNLPELVELDLADAPATDASLPELERLGHVHEMRIFETGLSKQGIKTLQDRLAHTKVSELPPDPVATRLAMRRIYRHAVVTAAFSPDDATLFTGNGEGELIALDAGDGEPIAHAQAHQNWAFSVAVSPDGKSIATGGGDNLIRLWDSASLEQRAELKGHVDDVHGVAFNRAGDTLFSAGDDRTLRAWNLATQKQLYQIPAHDGAIPSLSYSRPLDVVATGSRDGTVKLWEASTGTLRGTLSGHDDDVNSVAFSDDGGILASGSYDGTVRIWDPVTQSATRVLRCGECRVHAVRFSPDARCVAAAASDGRVRIWVVETGKLRRTTRDHDCPANVVFSRDGTSFATLGADGSVALRKWNSVGMTDGGLEWQRYVIPTYVAGN